jgi:photosystem II stability/assembly factor-like uncharacterized protein
MKQMNKSSFALILLLFVFACSKSKVSNTPAPASSWKQVATPSTNDLNDIFFSNNSFGIACGSFGTMLKTDNAGESWQSLDVVVGYSFMSVFALNDAEFFTARIGLHKTFDSGASFNEIGNLSTTGASISDIHFFNSQEGIIAKGSSIYFTNDSGNTWTNVYPFGSYARMLEVTDNSTVYLAGGNTFDSVSGGELHKSIDNGETWAPMTLPQEIGSSQITAISFLSSQIGYVSTFDNKIFKTIDGGDNWIGISELNFEPITDLTFPSENSGYLISGNRILATMDGGIEWKEEQHSASTSTFTTITASPNGTVYVCGLGGAILKRE